MNKFFKILFSEKVYEDFQEIPSPISSIILDNIEMLKNFPFMGKPVESKTWEGYQLIVKDYRIIYTVDEQNETVEIYHIRHGKRFFN